MLDEGTFVKFTTAEGVRCIGVVCDIAIIGLCVKAINEKGEHDLIRVDKLPDNWQCINF